MIYDSIHSILAYFLKKRQTQINKFIEKPIITQHNLLMGLLKTASKTAFGKKHNFETLQNYDDFAKEIPLCTYENITSTIEKIKAGNEDIHWHGKIHWFAKSSGTTNAKSKFIPVSDEAIEYGHFKAGKDMLSLYINNNPDTKIFTGKNLRLGGSHRILENSSTFVGDLSSIIIENMPFWADFSSSPNQKVALMDNWEEKIDTIAKATIKENITSLAGVPSWMLVLLNRVLELTGTAHILEVWENLEVYFHGGVNFDPYRNQYEKIIPSKIFQYFEIYNASEGFFAVQHRLENKELLLLLDHGIFYEFIPMDDFQIDRSKTIPLSAVEIGKPYAMVITTNAGLWRYVIGDVVYFTSLKPHRIKICGRTKSYINVFGEELMVHNAEKALAKTCAITGAMVCDYTVAPVFMNGTQKGRHQWLIEFIQKPKNLTDFTKHLDDFLQEENSDYAAKRLVTMGMLEVVVAPEKLFHNWLKSQNKLGGQHKIPRLCNDRKLIIQLFSMMKKRYYQSNELPQQQPQ